MENVEVEYDNNHACTGVVLACEETGRTIATFWHYEDAEEAMEKINQYNHLVSALQKVLDDAEIGTVPKSHLNHIEGLLREYGFNEL